MGLFRGRFDYHRDHERLFWGTGAGMRTHDPEPSSSFARYRSVKFASAREGRRGS
jgi:hypothetical protein